MATDSFLNSEVIQVEDGEGEREVSYQGLSQGSDGAQNGDGDGGDGAGEDEEDIYTQSEGVKKFKKCPEAVDAFKVLWIVSKSVAKHDLGNYYTSLCVGRA